MQMWQSKYAYYGLIGIYFTSLSACAIFETKEYSMKDGVVITEKETSVLKVSAPGAAAFRDGMRAGQSTAILATQRQIDTTSAAIQDKQQEEATVIELEETALNQNVILKKLRDGLKVPGTITLADQRVILATIDAIEGLEESLATATNIQEEKFYNDKINAEVKKLNDFVVRYQL